MKVAPWVMVGFSWLVLSAAQAADRQGVDRAFFLTKSASIARVEAIDEDGRMYMGTGVTVAPQKVVTNCHVTRRAVRVYLISDAVRIPVTAQSANEARDVCVLTIPAWRRPAVTLSTERQQIGQKSVGMGFIGGAGLSLREGELLHFHPYLTGEIIQTSTPFTSGASGGALLNLNAELVGLLTFRLRGGHAHYFAIPARWIEEALIHDAAQASPVAPLSGAPTFWEQPPHRLPYFLRVFQHRVAGMWDAQAQTALDWTQSEPNNELAWFSLGEAQLKEGRANIALPALRRAARLAPNSVPIHATLATALVEIDELEEAARVTEIVRQRDGLEARQLDQLISLKHQ